MGRLLVEAQGGEERAKYGNKLIEKYSRRLSKELGKGYSTRNLKRMRKYFLFTQKGTTVSAQLQWSHYIELLRLKDINEINYYIYISEIQNLSVRQLREKIRSNEYERIGYKAELEEPKVNTLIKNPVIIKTDKKISDKVSEYALHEFILEDMENFLKELGNGFAYIGHEVKIKIGDNYNYIDFLLFNFKFNCYVIVEMKVTKMKAEYIGQVKKYMNYVDKNIKEVFNDKSVGVIICKKEDKYVLEYCSDNRIFTTTYEVIKK